MDPTGLLAAVLATAVYPGAAFLVIAAVVHGRVAGRPAALRSSGSPPASSLIPVLAAIVAVAMLPLPGSPALHLPASSGVGGNLVAVIVLLGVAVDLGGGSARVRILAALAALPVLALAAEEGTLSVVALSGPTDGFGAAARILTAALLVLAAASTARGRAASVVAASLALAAAAAVVPDALAGVAPLLGAAACLGVVAAAAVVGRLGAGRGQRLLSGLGPALAVAGVVAALLSDRA